MFELNGNILMVNLPSGKTQKELLVEAREEIREMIKKGWFYGKHLKVNGRITTSISMFLGHELAHICRSVSLFDPKENEYIPVISH